MVSKEELKFDEKGLIPAIVADCRTGKILMLAYMNRESLDKTIETGLACFWSRSRKALWTKGETSGNFLHVVSVKADCDRDTLLVSARPDGPACHMGNTSCFEDVLWENADGGEFSFDSLMELIKGRKTDKKEGSYTTYLFEKKHKFVHYYDYNQ